MDWVFMAPSKYKGKLFQLLVSPWKYTLKPVDCQDRKHVWFVRKLWDLNFHEPKTLKDIGMTATILETVNQTVLNLWFGASTSVEIPNDNNEGYSSLDTS